MCVAFWRRLFAAFLAAFFRARSEHVQSMFRARAGHSSGHAHRMFVACLPHSPRDVAARVHRAQVILIRAATHGVARWP
eukprot:7833461-Lingulodinium_polyedra.AAC.1